MALGVRRCLRTGGGSAAAHLAQRDLHLGGRDLRFRRDSVDDATPVHAGRVLFRTKHLIGLFITACSEVQNLECTDRQISSSPARYTILQLEHVPPSHSQQVLDRFSRALLGICPERAENAPVKGALLKTARAASAFGRARSGSGCLPDSQLAGKLD